MRAPYRSRSELQKDSVSLTSDLELTAQSQRAGSVDTHLHVEPVREIAVDLNLLISQDWFKTLTGALNVTKTASPKVCKPLEGSNETGTKTFAVRSMT
jgi:hypothetical protein